MRSIVVDKNDRLASSARTAGKKTRPASRARKSKQPAKAFVTDMMTSFLKLNLRSTQKKATPSVKKTKAQSRRKPKPVWWKPTAVLIAVTLFITPIGYLGYKIVQNDFVGQFVTWTSVTFDQKAAELGLSVQEISVKGRQRTSPDQIMRALNAERGDNIFRFDPKVAKDRLEALGWVETAMVKRNLPDQIFVKINERRPFVRWQLDGKNALVDRKGNIISTLAKDQAEFRYLPKVVGKGANLEAASLFDLMSETPALFTRVRNAVRVRDRRWNIEFENGVTVMLPEKLLYAAWQKLAGLQGKNNILAKDLVSIDLRATDKVYVRLSPDAAVLRRAQDEET